MQRCRKNYCESYIVTEILHCREFVNADTIAAELSPHNPEKAAIDVVERRFYRGIYNLINLYIPVVDDWFIFENMDASPEMVARGKKEEENNRRFRSLENHQSPNQTIMKQQELSFDELSEKLLIGTKLAVKKLVIETAAKDGSLVVRDKKGNIREVPARELLKDLEQDL